MSRNIATLTITGKIRELDSIIKFCRAHKDFEKHVPAMTELKDMLHEELRQDAMRQDAKPKEEKP